MRESGIPTLAAWPRATKLKKQSVQQSSSAEISANLSVFRGFSHVARCLVLFSQTLCVAISWFLSVLDMSLWTSCSNTIQYHLFPHFIVLLLLSDPLLGYYNEKLHSYWCFWFHKLKTVFSGLHIVQYNENIAIWKASAVLFFLFRAFTFFLQFLVALFSWSFCLDPFKNSVVLRSLNLFLGDLPLGNLPICVTVYTGCPPGPMYSCHSGTSFFFFIATIVY